jgi:hypothetical protein
LQEAQRLAAERGLTVLRARASPVEREFPYGVVRQLFEPAVVYGEVPAAQVFAGAARSARSVLGDEACRPLVGESSFAAMHGLYWLRRAARSRD